jgi:hypothetical protein
MKTVTSSMKSTCDGSARVRNDQSFRVCFGDQRLVDRVPSSLLAGLPRPVPQARARRGRAPPLRCGLPPVYAPADRARSRAASAPATEADGGDGLDQRLEGEAVTLKLHDHSERSSPKGA